MKRALALALSALAPLVVPAAQAAGGSPPAEPPKAGERCESAVADTVRRMRGRDAQEVAFVGARRVVAPADREDEIGVKGEGRYHGPAAAGRMFTYSCAYNTKTGATSGVVFRDAPDARAAAGEAPWEPDLTRISPQDCETAAASQLKRKYPRVARIAFGGDSRQLRPAPNDLTRLEGQGAVQRAPGMNATPFRYRCEIEPRSGKVVNVETSD